MGEQTLSAPCTRLGVARYNPSSPRHFHHALLASGCDFLPGGR